jgi:hypothetical protein
MFFRRPQYRRFDYEPRYYKPELDHSERFKRQLRAQRAKRVPPRRMLVLIFFLFLALYLYLVLSGSLR